MLLAESTPLVAVSLILVIVLWCVMCLVFVLFFSTWLKALLSGVPIMLVELIRMRIRRTDVAAVVQCLIMAKHGGVQISCAEMEKAWIQKVDIEKVTLAMVRAKREGLDVTFQDLVDAELDDRLAEKLQEHSHGRPEELACR
jgi:uncharacterized protein YqfA (UPF0365 family)